MVICYSFLLLQIEMSVFEKIDKEELIRLIEYEAKGSTELRKIYDIMIQTNMKQVLYDHIHFEEGQFDLLVSFGELFQIENVYTNESIGKSSKRERIFLILEGEFVYKEIKKNIFITKEKSVSSKLSCFFTKQISPKSCLKQDNGCIKRRINCQHEELSSDSKQKEDTKHSSKRKHS